MSAASRAAPQRPLSFGSKNALPRGMVPCGMIATMSPLASASRSGLQRLVAAGAAVDADAAHRRGDLADHRGVEHLLLAEEAHRPLGPGDGERHRHRVEVAAVVADDDRRSRRRDVLGAG